MTNLTFIQLFRELRHHRKLSERRDPMFESNKAAKWIMGFLVSFVIVYLIMFAVIFSLDANESRQYTSMEYMAGMLPFILAIDFGVRLLAQQTPSQIIKPYVLLPIPQYACIDSFIVNSLLGWGNLTWFIMLVPFCLMSVLFSYGLLTSVSLLLLFYFIILTNSQWYAVCRTLINISLLWWILPLGVFAVMFLPWIVTDFTSFFRLYASLGTNLEHGNVLPHLIALLALCGIVAINRKVQYESIWQELGKYDVTRLKSVSRFHWLDRYGEIGEYMKLEIKSLMRNKNPRKTFAFAVLAIVFISALVTFTPVYDEQLMTNFWCIYCFAIFGGMILIKVMSYEANYIEPLLIHKENIFILLRAKYYFFCMLLLIPFVLMLPMVVMGKWNICMLIAYGVFTAGFQYFLIMQMAVYNKRKMPLNEKLIGKGGMENSYVQILAETVAFFLPLAIIEPLERFFGDYVAWGVMLVIGIIFILIHKVWIRNIYRRMMTRRYENLEAFLNS